MFETVVVATDGSASVGRAVAAAIDLADRFDAAVHALSVVDAREVESAPDSVREDVRDALERKADDAVTDVAEKADAEGLSVTTAVRTGRPAQTIPAYASEIEADAIAVGTRGRHGENRFLVGSVAQRVVEASSIPVLTVRSPDAPEM